jgi:hypothetical protein
VQERFPAGRVRPALDPATRALLEELEGSPTDLARLLRRVIDRRGAVLIVSTEGMAAWEARASEAWARARSWLESRGTRILVVGRERTGGGRAAP